MRRLSVTAVIVFAVVFASSYTYLTWSPDEIAGLLPRLRAFVAEHIHLPGLAGRDSKPSGSPHSDGERNTNIIASPERAEAPENTQGSQQNGQGTNLEQWERPGVAIGDPKGRIVSQSRLDLAEQPGQIDADNSQAEVATLANPPRQSPEDAVTAPVPATQAEGFAGSRLDPQRARPRDPSAESEKQAVARRDHTEAIDSGVVERGGKWVISGDLERALLAHSLNTQRMPDGSIKITLHGVVPTERGRIRLDAKATQSLEKLAFVLRNYEGFTVQVVANADPTDRRDLEQWRRRAQAIAKYLIVRGVPIHRIHSPAHGETERAIAMSDTQQRTRQERAIEIFLRPIA